jgi:peptidoglycan hydrolase-like protein with peptidoglycan-binding domain
MRGNDVKELQTKLQSLGYEVGPIDGIFGPLTEKAVKQFQKDNRIKVDGIVGPQTYDMLAKLIP